MGLAAAAAPSWEGLNTTLAGRLQTATPLALACFPSYNDTASAVGESACAALRQDYTKSLLRTTHAPSYMSLQSDIASPAGMPPAGSVCNQGSVPSFYVSVESETDVIEAFKFAKENGIDISIKNTKMGNSHDFMIRSSGKGTLNLWTHDLQGMTHNELFTPKGCDAGVGAVMEVAVGVTVQDAYTFADEYNSTILGPYFPTVAVSGGWVMGGGHSVYGLGADRVVEFQIVTPDGVLRTASACEDPDLFWALRGGGGGTFGLVLSATHRVEPRMPIAYADIRLPSDITSETALEWVELLLEDSLEWGLTGWGGHVTGTYVVHANPLPAFTSDNGAAAKAAFKRQTDFALAHGGTSTIVVGESFRAVWHRYIQPDPASARNGARVVFVSSRLLPNEKFATPEARGDILAYMRRAQQLGFDPKTMYTPVTTPYTYNGSALWGKPQSEHGTSMTPAWYGALWHFETSESFAWNATYEERLDALVRLSNMTRQAEALDGLGDKGGSYQNEANPFTRDWRRAYWGDDYPRLLEVENKYDPDRLLNCWKCVGFEEGDMEGGGFGCTGRVQGDVDRALQE
ncbi:isoamyl alcohol oxidase [Apiospora marii]|uniref:Isoamyl alcohol oxidase n=1 Tax=Apiospora marii TaxID=335849 RepID=A0ABR1R9P6_9PEZI